MKTYTIILVIFIFSLISIKTNAQQYGWYVIDPVSIPGTPDFSDVFFTDDNTGWITSGSINNIFKTVDGGETFEVQTTQLTTSAIHMLNENEGYSGGASGFVYRTTNGGTNWPFHGTIGATLEDITFPPSGGTGYACGFNGAISSITSTVVTPMNSGVPDHLSSITFPINSSEGWVCGGSIIRHFTAGAWVGDQFRPSGGYNAIYMVDTLNGWSVGDYGIIIHTTDGQNWFEQTNPDNNSLFDVFFLNENEGWAVGNGGTILHTTNGGTNWAVEGAGLTSNFLTGVHFTNSNNGYVVGQGKTLIKYGELIGISPVGGILPENYELFQNYPNPFNPKTVISYRLPVISDVKLIVYDMLGREVATLVNEKLSAGSYEVDWPAPTGDASNYVSGVYFYRLEAMPDGRQAGDYVETKKMLLIK